jgi:uncharacterized protein (DUF4415 family)
MKRTSSSKTLDTSDDAPKLTPADFERARPRIAGRDVSRAEWQAAVRQRVGKLRISIMLDAPIVEHFKALAGERLKLPVPDPQTVQRPAEGLLGLLGGRK